VETTRQGEERPCWCKTPARVFAPGDAYRHQTETLVYLATGAKVGERLIYRLTVAFNVRQLGILAPFRGSQASQVARTVMWETEAMAASARVALDLDSPPLGLFYFGLWAHSVGKLLVCCEPRLWHTGDVRALCALYGIPVFEDEGPWADAVAEALHVSRRP
jgi:hypothetical protein